MSRRDQLALLVLLAPVWVMMALVLVLVLTRA